MVFRYMQRNYPQIQMHNYVIDIIPSCRTALLSSLYARVTQNACCYDRRYGYIQKSIPNQYWEDKIKYSYTKPQLYFLAKRTAVSRISRQ